MLSIVLLVGSLSAQTAQTPNKGIPAQGPPPKKLSVRPDGHVTANQDPDNPDKFEVHIVMKGETLSQISGAALKNPRLWPQLWEQNEHIINPHWIYPDDKILIRPVTPLAEAKPPEPEAPQAPPPAPEPEPPAAPRRFSPPVATTAPPPASPSVIFFDSRPPAPEIKFADLYCSGFVRRASLPKDLKVIAKYDATGAVLASDTDYVYISQGAEEGITAGSNYQVVRPTKTMTNPYGHTGFSRDLGMHYLDIAQIRIVVVQPRFSLARVMNSCGDAIEVGDRLMPFERIVIPPPPRPRPFTPTMTTNSGISGVIVTAKTALLNFGSAFRSSGIIPGVRGSDRLGVTDRGIAAAGDIVYIDLGQDQQVKPGDIFIVYRHIDFDQRLFPGDEEELEKLRNERTAVGEVIVMQTGERASSAVVTYATDALSLGDEVERR
jgi:LysM domain